MKGQAGSFHLFNELSEHITLRIGSCHSLYHDSRWREVKEHSDYDLWIVEEGTVTLRMGDVNGTAKAGDLILFYPNVPYTASNGEEGCRFIYVHFDFGIGDRSRILDNFPLSGIVAGSSVQEEAALFRQAFERYSNRSVLSSVRLKGCLTVLLAKIIENAAESEAAAASGEPADTPPKARASRQMDILQPVFRFVHEQLHRPIAVRELAEKAGMSEKYFITFFKQTVGVTPGYYLYQVRMNRARDYLYRRSYTIKQIAELLGYPDPYTFSKAFKKYYNKPPSQFV
ncbi:AraC family transcriptional regulator [Paenibacillus oceani]|uniref:Helix-turn-helix transcriptional regulator n=1 Tax=Paenibacillus oceani TaxID=2772510 RepID=A0A927H2V8_9BACL|nr:AraC family transcriptional regulator [Paenibacillus oceani]MBD2866641.1 helix-turn-helix transcriptional regulator [Paenibacillus oceani]